MIWFTMGVAVGMLLMWGWQHKPKRRPQQVGTPPSKSKTYGHPHAPVPYLKRNLPDAPSGYFWEIRVTPDSSGTPFLHVALINAISGSSVADTKSNLVSRGFNTYAHDYRRYRMISGEIFKNDLMGPLLDWADRQVNKFSDPSTVGEYTVES